jgi:hypothetical protein
LTLANHYLFEPVARRRLWWCAGELGVGNVANVLCHPLARFVIRFARFKMTGSPPRRE